MVRVVLAALVLVFVVLVFMAASSCGGAGNRATWYAQVTAPPRLAWILSVLFPSHGPVRAAADHAPGAARSPRATNPASRQSAAETGVDATPVSEAFCGKRPADVPETENLVGQGFVARAVCPSVARNESVQSQRSKGFRCGGFVARSRDENCTP